MDMPIAAGVIGRTYHGSYSATIRAQSSGASFAPPSFHRQRQNTFSLPQFEDGRLGGDCRQGDARHLRGETWREVEIGRGSSDAACPVMALETRPLLGRIVHGPLSRRVAGQGKKLGAQLPNRQEVARLVKRPALTAGGSGDFSEGDRERLFAGHSLRAGSPHRSRSTRAMCRNSLGVRPRK